eukprot:TRINITY_DN14675_c0_g1_i1.p1 TRINITY_DN14675_c0_g1~~TRINITY_DN14675_c0_g1_i1.p1  ORF type:complete len:276 (+),score=69.14 TRINITY_DN14675_c0_g1_i1:99-926(+)
MAHHKVLINKEAEASYGSLTEAEETEHGRVLFQASFLENEAKYVSYITWGLFFASLLMAVFYGVGLLLLFWIPVLRSNARKDLQSRRLYITSENVVYKTAAPAFCPCFGVNKTEKHILLPLITDVILSQSWFEAWFGIYSVKIENPGQAGLGTQAGADVIIQGIHQPEIFKKVLLRAAGAKRAGLQFTADDVQQILNTPGEYAPYQQVGLGPFGTGSVAAAAMNPAMTQAMDQMSNTLLRIEQLLIQQNQRLASLPAAYPPLSTTPLASQSLLPL